FANKTPQITVNHQRRTKKYGSHYNQKRATNLCRLARVHKIPGQHTEEHVKALRFHKFGPPSVLAIEEVPRPEPHDGEALVQVKAAAINPSDVKNVSGNFPATTLPRTPGRDFAGIVVTGKKYEGEAVGGSGPGLGATRDGAQAEYVV